MAIAAHDEYIIASRGFGKSEGIDALRIIRNVFAMPRSSGALLSPTYGKLLRNTLPAIFHALDRLGYKRNIHYVLGRKPPKNLNYKTPYIDPFNYDYVIAWFNGSIQHLISFDRPMSANSMSLDYVFGFESKFLDFDKIKNEVLPANRGNNQYFKKCPWHHGVLFTTDMPTNKMGSWIFDKEKDMDPDLIRLIRLTYAEYRHYKEKKHEMYRLKTNSLFMELNRYRKMATFYAEYDAFDNIEILGESFIKQMKRDLPPLVFRTAILNERMRKIENGFYSALNEKIHYYEAENNSFLDSLDYNIEKASKKNWHHDNDIDPTLPLIIANDYNAAINTVVIAQVVGKEMRTLNSLFVKTPRKLKELINEFSDYYDDYPNRDIVYYYDSTAIYTNAADSQSFSDIVIEALRDRGWNVNNEYIGQPIRHTLKHQQIDLALKGDEKYLFPTFNSTNNEYLLLAMEQTGIKMGRNGFEKDKSAEKDPDTPESPDELKTHITDAWDTLFIGIHHYAVNIRGAIGSASTW